jgi:hypothetical protein
MSVETEAVLAYMLAVGVHYHKNIWAREPAEKERERVTLPRV